MTYNDIKKALEWCKVEFENCEKCPYGGIDCLTEKGESLVMRDALDLINRKDAEIEKLNVELVGMRGACKSYKMHYENAQAEIERLRHEYSNAVLTIITLPSLSVTPAGHTTPLLVRPRIPPVTVFPFSSAH